MHKNLISFLTFSAILSAADISGSWQAERTVQNGRKLEFYYVFKADGNKFTGRMVSNREQREIVNGKTIASLSS